MCRGGQDSDQVVITVNETQQVNQKPIAVASAESVDLAVNQNLSDIGLNALSSYDPDMDPIVSYYWRYGDETGATASNPNSHIGAAYSYANHFYAQAGTYTISLYVSDGKEWSYWDQVIVNVNEVQNPPPVNNPPLAEAGANQAIKPWRNSHCIC